MTALLKVSHLSASYGAGPVIADLSVEVPGQAVVGIIGPNGHGKTSLLRAISGLMPRRSGSIRFDGKEIGGMRPERIAALGVVHIPQGDLVYKQMSVFENLQVGGFTNRLPSQTATQLERVFALFPKLRERSDQSASSLSGGERRMLGIGRGLMMADARLIMLDEPSLGLAPIVIDQIYDAIRALKASGLAIVIVEENVGRVATIADDLHLIDRGEIVLSGPSQTIAANHQLLETYLGA